MFPPRSIADHARAMRTGELSPAKLVEACLRQIEKYEPQLQAWVIVDEMGARRAAEELGDELAAGHDRGPLHGIPVGIKDIIDVRGFPTRAGAAVWRDRPPADRDATLVTRLRDAGAIILGKTVTTEFASFDPSVTRNPWHAERTPGGSSSGSAAAVVAGMCPAAIGSQTGGSITRPATFCGIAGCKPTFGRISRRGVVPVSHHVDTLGPMARTVSDLAILLQALAGPDANDPLALSAAVPDYLAALETREPPRLGVLKSYFFDKAQPQVVAAVAAATDLLASRGATVKTAELPAGFDRVHRMHRTVTAYEAAEYHREEFARHSERYGREIAAFLRDGLATSEADYRAARAHQERFQRAAAESLAGYDALLAPAAMSTAPDLTTTGDPAFNAPWTYSGLPTVSIPCGLAEDRLPVGLQFIGRPLGESPLLAAAAWCERQLAFSQLPPLLRSGD